MAANNLSAVLKAHGNAVKLLRNSKIGMYVYPVVAPEFSNWRSEQMAWRHSAVLFDQTHHMDELIVEGPDAAAFLEHVGVNSFANFDLNRAKHFVPVTPAGHVIGDMIIFREREDKFVLVGRAPTANWVKFQAAINKYRVRLTHDPRSDSRPDGKAIYRTHYRFQIQGPDANKIFDKINGGPVPDIKFFHVDWIKIGSRRVQALRHGMAGAPGPRGIRPLRRQALHPVDDHRSRARRGRRPAFGRRSRVLDEHARVRLDPLAAARHLHRRRHDAGLPRLARRRQLRGSRFDWRQLRQRQDRGLLRQSVRARLRLLHRLEERVHRQSRR